MKLEFVKSKKFSSYTEYTKQYFLTQESHKIYLACNFPVSRTENIEMFELKCLYLGLLK